ncbi:MAG: class I SAM-dependent methyltransferase [Verrucomicrobia bacterium]|nr:class I SAM-dependent methyltransferase [Verrucomicrobiota bacterium]
MSFEAFLRQLHTLNSSLETLAAIGAELRLRQDEHTGDAGVRSLLQNVVHKIDPTILDEINPSQAQSALGLIRSSFRQAMDLLEKPERAPGWVYEDPVVLDSQGQASRLMVRGIETAAGQRADLAAKLQQPGMFLDAGAGAGWLTIEAAQSWPALNVVAVDPWPPALDLARKNLAQSSVAARVEFRLQRIEELTDEAVFALAWLPAPFIGEEAMAAALERVYQALRPGGWLIVGLYPPTPDELGQILTKLRIVRSGGHPWTATEIGERLRTLGFESIETFSPMPPVLFVLGQRAEGTNKSS